MRHGRALGDAVLRGRITARQRKLVTVAVSRVNACARCTLVHERWALHAGVTADELRALDLADPNGLGARSRAAVAYATARTEDRFRRPAPADVTATARASLTRREIDAVDAVARAMTLANLTASTAELALARLRRPAPASGT